MSVVAHLLRIAGPDLYARNPFRIMWLKTQSGINPADWRRLGILADVGLADWPRLGIAADIRPRGNVVTGSDLWLPTPLVTRQLLDRATSALKSPEERVAEELFWYWDEAHGCGCPSAVHLLHNEAVRAHATVLYLEDQWLLQGERRDEAWREAARSWRVALAHKGFWHHVRRRAGDTVVDLNALRAALPRALLQPQAELAAQRDDIDLLALLDAWNVGRDIRTEAIRRAATPRLRRARAALVEILDLRAGSLPSAYAVDGLVKTLYFVEKALPDERSEWTADIRGPVEELCALCGITVAATADTRDLCSALEDAARWLRAEEARRDTAWRAAQRSRVTPWSYQPDRGERFDRVQRMIAAGSFRSATRELEAWRTNATTRSEREEIRRLLDDVERRRAQTEGQPEAGPARRQAWVGWKAVAAILAVLMLVLLVVLLLLP